MLNIYKKFFFRSSSSCNDLLIFISVYLCQFIYISSKRVSACLTACRVDPGHEVRLVQQMRELFIAALSRMLSGLCGLVVLSPAWKTTDSRFDSQ